MSRPPRPHPARSTGGTRTDAQDRLDYLPMEYADFLDLERGVAVRGLGRGTDQRDDVADTFLQLSALVGHVLAVYQRQYAREAYLSTAQAASSLVRHAHRLGSEPDPGLAASGYVVLFTKPGVSGVVAAGQPLASVPVGQEKAQDYETSDDLAVDAVLNELVPVQSIQPQVVAAEATEISLAGTGLGLAVGDEVALIGNVARDRLGTVIQQVSEVGGRSGRTVLQLADGVPAMAADPPGDGQPVLLAHPAVVTRSLGFDADPVQYPPNSVQQATDNDGGASIPPAGTIRWWFTATRTDGGAYSNNDIYFSEQLPTSLVNDYVLCSSDRASTVFLVVSDGVATVALNRSEQVDVTPQKVTVSPTTDGGFTTSVSTDPTQKLLSQRSHIGGTVTSVRVADAQGHLLPRSKQPLNDRWLAGWQVRAPLAATVPNVGSLGQSLTLPGLLPTLAPGRPVVFHDPLTGAAQVVRLRRITLDAVNSTTTVEWDPLTADPVRPWTLDRLLVHANVAPVSHGRTVHETVLASDGVTPFQARVLRETPLTYLPGVDGAEPQLEVRVAGVRWTAVADFANSSPDDRHYRIVTAADHSTSVLFGDGQTGAVPPAGAALEATYRIGRGSAGNLTTGRLSRVKRAHPLLDHVLNETPVAGGTEPSGPNDVRGQATRWIRTFDRAVSVADLADLALTMPGVARASAHWDLTQGAVLVVATAAGDPPNPLSAVRAFLDARRDTGIRLKLTGPTPHDLVVAVIVTPDPAWLPETVSATVRTALITRFDFPAEDLGAPGYLSEVYALLEELPGVVSVRVDRFASVGNTEAADAVLPEPSGWLRLQPQNLAVTVTGRAS